MPFVMVAGAGILSVYAFFDPARHSLFPQCAFHQLTGLDCPGCGGQRALHQLLHGNLIEAFRFNALLIMLMPVGLWMGIRQLLKSLTGAQWPVLFRTDGWVWILAAAALGFTIVRNLPAASFF